MKIKEVKLRRVYNMGNYESLGVELIADVEEGENVLEVLKELNNTADKYKTNLK